MLPQEGDDDGNQGDEEEHTEDAHEISAHQHGHQGPQGVEPHSRAHHVGIDELIFHKLHDEIENDAEKELFRRG